MVEDSFFPRELLAGFTLPQGHFPGTSSDTLTVPCGGLSGLRASVTISGAASYPSACDLRIYGLRAADMNALSVIFAGSSVARTAVNARAHLTLSVVSASGGMQRIYYGQFIEAYPDYSDMPEVALVASCKTGYGFQVLSHAPTSFNGAVSVATVAAQFAKQMGFAFENNGVTGMLRSPYFAGTLMDQLVSLCEAGGCDYYLLASGTLAICPKNQPRQAPLTKVLTGKSGLVGYPQVQRFGVSCECIFDPAIELGSPVQIGDSAARGASPQAGGLPYGTAGLWFPYSATHTLETQTPGGAWFSSLNCAPTAAAAAGEAGS